ncbi:hypothetical protein BB560_005694 [Smittium megazygosporum]|uniref:Uncharacterized protein n=1 Tax=Smittium megazygosporum TaxID=133381 RepID=A0A2T9Z114_9FUNG|nr:hypothetical protein BB560_005694 [Smittium megazygosporum]
MGLTTNIATGVTLLTMARAYSVALQGKPLFQKKAGYVIWAGIGAFLGYGAFVLKKKAEADIERRYEELVENRNKRHSEASQ